MWIGAAEIAATITAIRQTRCLIFFVYSWQRKGKTGKLNDYETLSVAQFTSYSHEVILYFILIFEQSKQALILQ